MSNSKLFSRKFMYIILIIGFTLSVAVIGTGYFAWINNSHEAFEEEMRINSERLTARLGVIDKLYYSLETNVEEQLIRGINEVNDYYEVNGRFDVEELERQKRRDNYIDYYVIDRNHQVIMTTKLSDYNLDFSSYGYFTEYLNSIFESDEIVSNRIEVSTKSSDLMKYVYLPTKDKKYIIEASYNFDGFQEFIGEDSLENFEATIQDTNDSITNVMCYSSYGIRLGEKYNIAKEEPEKYKLIQKARRTGEIQKVSVERNNIEYVTMYIPYNFFEIEGQMNSLQKIIFVMEYNNRKLTEKARHITIGFIGLLLVLCIVLLVIKLYYDRKYSLPMEKLIKNVESINLGELDTRFQIEGSNEVQELAGSFNRLLNNIEETSTRREEALFDIVKALANAVDAKDSYTGGHCQRVMEMSLIIGEGLALSKKDMDALKYSSILHDIGKIGIPDIILKKPGKYDKQEYSAIQAHPEIGANILKDVDSLASLSDIIRDHHERIDGNGYPNSKSASEINQLAKIISIADAFDAMTSERIYKKNIRTVSEAFSELNKHSGTQFDEYLVKVFEEVYMTKYGVNLDEDAETVEHSKEV